MAGNDWGIIMQRTETVSDPAEQLILVDSDDRDVGVMPKWDCHRGEGVLHRAFSIFVFNSAGEVLLQQRSQEKPLWPLFWSNACCSHPRSGEDVETALQRRLREELGIQCPLTYLYKFEYQAFYGDVGAEHELCSVYVGQHDGPFDPNNSELADLRFFGRTELGERLRQHPAEFTPWFRMEWQRIDQALARSDGNVGMLRSSNV